jgi:hypothetical protein
MSVGIAQHIRSNVVGYLALFVALSGTAYAVDGPLAGQNQVGSEDIINEEVKRDDLGPDAVRTGKVLNETLLAEDIATGGISSSEVLNSTLTHFDLGTDSVRYPELAPGAFDPAEIAEVAPGFVFGIANDAIQSNEVSVGALTGSDISADSLTGSDINEASLTPSIHAVHAKGPDLTLGPPITSETNVLTDNIGAGTWIVFGEVQIYNTGAATEAVCRIYTDDTEREYVTKDIEAEFDDSNYDLFLPLTAVFTTTSSTTLRLACLEPGQDVELRARSADLVAIPVASVG